MKVTFRGKRVFAARLGSGSWNGECPALSGMQGPLEGERKEMVLDGGMQPRRYLDFSPMSLILHF